MTESLHDKQMDRVEYSAHIRESFINLIEFEMEKNNTILYYEILKNLKKNKQLLLQHFYTFEYVGKTSPIYTRYFESITNDKKKKNRRSELRNMIWKIDSDVWNELKNYDFYLIDGDVIREILGIPKLDDLPENLDLKNILPKNSDQFLKGSFKLEEVKEYLGKSYHVKYKDKIVASTDSKKTAKKLIKILPEKCRNTSKKLKTLISQDLAIEKYGKPALEHIFNNITESIKSGTPNFGVCDACVGFFPFEQKKAYQNRLDWFNFNPYSWSKDL